MSRTYRFQPLTRVEGHGGITLVLEGGAVSEVRFDILEGIRLFEGLVVGHSAGDVPAIVARICAICSHAHSITALAALEAALGISVSPQTRRLRHLGMLGGTIESHALHLFMLALPDFIGQEGIVGFARQHPEVATMGLRLKKLGNTIQEIIGGRAVHPVNYVLGGFGRLPAADDLLALRQELAAGIDDCLRVRDFLRTVEIPSFADQSIRCAALVPEDEAFLFGEKVSLSDGNTIPVPEYRRLANEHAVSHSHARHSSHDGRSYMVGALARVTLNGGHLGGLARMVQGELGLALPSSNILMNNLAQFVEIMQSLEHARELVEQFRQDGLRPESPPPVRPRPGRGRAATEAPRGVLFHSYELDEKGRIAAADVITPTAQNLNHAEDQLRAAVREAGGLPEAALVNRLEIIARAYDPCISCSVHVIRAG
jgi:sulfhydrogenase subunit alpha